VPFTPLQFCRTLFYLLFSPHFLRFHSYCYFNT